MAKVVNLGQVRKAAARRSDQAEACANAAKFGRTKAQRVREVAAAEKAARDLDGHRRETD